MYVRTIPYFDWQTYMFILQLCGTCLFGEIELFSLIGRKVLKEIYVGELQPDETVDAMREARLLSNVCLILHLRKS